MPDVVRDCARAGVRGVVVVSAGFAEASEAGRAAERALVELVRSSGMRLVGPNCMGVLNTDPAVALNATFAPHWPAAGGVGMLSQSGALGLAILDHLRSLNLGVSTFVSVGNKADVSGNDLLAYWADDPRTRVVLLYLESFGNPRTFARLAPEVAREKPIVAVQSGRSAAGPRAARGRSAALASADVARRRAVRACRRDPHGARSRTCSTSPRCSRPSRRRTGARIGVVTNAGGPGVLLADACEARGLELPALARGAPSNASAHVLPADARSRIRSTSHATARRSRLRAGRRHAGGADPGVDAVVVIYVPPDRHTTRGRRGRDRARRRRACRSRSRCSPCSCRRAARRRCSAAGRAGRSRRTAFPRTRPRRSRPPSRWSRWRSSDRRHAARPRNASRATRCAPWWSACSRRRAARSGSSPRTWRRSCAPRASGSPRSSARRREGAAAAARRASATRSSPRRSSPGLLPGSDLRGVELGLDGPDALAAARATGSRHGSPSTACRLDGVLLQREVPAASTRVVGVTTDPTFGPLVGCGLGGPLVELLGDVSCRVPPVTDLDAEEMLSRLRAARLLAGYRGGAAGGPRRAGLDSSSASPPWRRSCRSWSSSSSHR